MPFSIAYPHSPVAPRFSGPPVRSYSSANDVSQEARVVFFKFYSGTWSSYLMDLLSPRLVGAVKSSCSQRGRRDLNLNQGSHG